MGVHVAPCPVVNVTAVSMEVCVPFELCVILDVYLGVGRKLPDPGITPASPALADSLPLSQQGSPRGTGMN